MKYFLKYLKLLNKYAILKIKYYHLLNNFDKNFWGDLL